MTVVYILIGLAVVAALYAIVIYNGLVSLKTRVSEAWSDIEVQMKVRYNLIPNLIETVKGYMDHERETLESVTRLRGAAMASQGEPGEQAQSENLLTGALKSLFALAENYPELKADRGFLDLQDDLAEVEDRIQAARRYYNGSVRNLNIKIEQFPSNLVARGFDFVQATFFELDEADAAARQPVKVQF
ncbi:MAG: LemA family protein [Alphaproteobacteria bacterium]